MFLTSAKAGKISQTLKKGKNYVLRFIFYYKIFGINENITERIKMYSTLHFSLEYEQMNYISVYLFILGKKCLVVSMTFQQAVLIEAKI